MVGPILKKTIVEPVIDLTKPVVSNILKKSSEIISKAEGKPKKIDESKIVKEKEEVVIDQTEGAAQAESGNVITDGGSTAVPKKVYPHQEIKPTDTDVNVILDLKKANSKSVYKNSKHLDTFNIKYIDSDQSIYDMIAAHEKLYKKKLTTKTKDADIEELASLLSKDKNKLSFDFLSTKPGEIPPPSKIRAFRDFYVFKVEQLDELAKKAVNGTDADRILFKQEMALVANLHQKLSAIRSDAGRALREWQLTSQSTRFSDNSFAELNMTHTLEKMGGADDIAQTAKMYLSLPKNKRAKFIDNAGFAKKLSDAVYESFINLILSNPITHVKNLSGNTFTLFNANFERSLAANFNRLIKRTDGVAHFEGYAKHYGMTMAYGEAVEMFFKALNGEQVLVAGSKIEAPASVFTSSKLGIKHNTIAKATDVIGKLATLNGIPIKSLNAGDTFFKTLAYRSELYALGWRKAFRLMKEGRLQEKDAGAFIANFVTHPTKEAQELAFKEAQYITFQTPTGVKGDMLSIGADGVKKIRKLPLGRYMITFIQTPTNILRYTAERTPGLNFLTNWNSQFMMGGANRDLALAKLSMGTMFILSAGSMGYFGTGTGTNASIKHISKNKKVQSQPYALEKALDIPQNSLIIGDYVISYNGLDPFGQMISQAIDIMQLGREIFENGGDKDAWTKAMVALAISVGENFFNKSYTKQSKEYFKIMSGDKDFLNNLSKSGKKIFESAFTPGLSRQVSRWEAQLRGDNTAKVTSNALEIGSMIQNIKNNTPGMGKDAPADYDIFGAPKHAYRFIRKKRKVDISPALFSELKRVMPDIKEIRKYLILDPLKMEVLKAKNSKNKRLQKQLSDLPRGRITVDLNHQEISEYRRIAGLMVKSGLEKFINSKAYKNAPNDYFKKTLILKEVSRIRSEVFEELLINGLFDRPLNIAKEKFKNELHGYN